MEERLVLELAQNLENNKITAQYIYQMLKQNPDIFKYVLQVWAAYSKEKAIEMLGAAKFESMMAIN